jgi:hypothetical protein
VREREKERGRERDEGFVVLGRGGRQEVARLRRKRTKKKKREKRFGVNIYLFFIEIFLKFYFIFSKNI